MFKNILKVFAVLLAVAALHQPAQAYADSGRHGSHGHGYDSYHFSRVNRHYPIYGRVEIAIPIGHTTIILGGDTYHYYGGIFYRQMNREYVVVAPPVGVVINDLPSGCQKVMINGGAYYTSNGVYYQHTPDGYAVVSQPGVTTVIQQPVTSIAPTQTVSPTVVDGVQLESFTVNIPNIKGGGYTAVIIKKSGDGFIGPQGEFYAAFPSVEQLQVMYAKKY